MNTIHLVLSSAAALTLIACGGGGGSGGSIDTQAPIADTFTPEDDAINVPTTTEVSARFDESILEASINPASFTLTNAQGDMIIAEVNYDNSNYKVTMLPEQNLALLATYEAKLHNVITDLIGNRLPETSWTFTTRDGVWGTEELIESEDVGSADNPQIAVEKNGDAIAVWVQSDGTRYNIYSNRFTKASNSWGSVELIGRDDIRHASNPQIAIDQNGDAVAVWVQSDGVTNIYSNRFTKSSNSWGTVTIIETGTLEALQPQIAVEKNGDAIAVWVQSDGTRYNIYSNRFTKSSNSWGTEEMIEIEGESAFQPQIAIDQNGDAIAVWEQSDGTIYNIYSNRFTKASNSWGSENVIETGIGAAFQPQIAIDKSGDAIAVWEQSDGIRSRIYSNSYNKESHSWDTEVVIGSTVSLLLEPAHVAVNQNGDAVVVWTSEDSLGVNNIYSNRYSKISNSWGTEEAIETGTSDASQPQIAMDDNGNALSVWRQYDGTAMSIYSNRFSSTSNSWSTEEFIETGTVHAQNPQIAIDSRGNAIAVWSQINISVYSIYSNIFK